MPAVHFKVRWPDGGVETCYSPSTIIKDYFQIGRSYTLAEFLEASRAGLQAASERVRQRYGGAGCSRAMAQLAAIEATVARHANDDASVRVEGYQQ